MAKIPHRLYLTEDQMPRQWYNLRADMPEQPDPMLNPATGKPLEERTCTRSFAKSWLTRRWTAKRAMSISPRASWRST